MPETIYLRNGVYRQLVSSNNGSIQYRFKSDWDGDWAPHTNWTSELAWSLWTAEAMPVEGEPHA